MPFLSVFQPIPFNLLKSVTRALQIGATLKDHGTASPTLLVNQAAN